MTKIIIKTKEKKYNILIKNNCIVSEIDSLQKTKKIFIIVDDKIFNLVKKFSKQKNIFIIKVPGGEKIKSISYYTKIYSNLLKLKIDRDSIIVAIGGGTVGDLSGYIASTILRGVNFILIPTTLLAQVDSSIGGKNGINTSYGKNQIGTFFQPDKVIIDTKVLNTLPKREIRNGYAEIFKHSLIRDEKFFIWLDKNYKKILNLESKYITKAIIQSIKIKSFFVEKDEKEKLKSSSSRAILNYGHTFGHAIETMNKYNNNFTHGEAISIGMSLAAKISYKMKYIKEDTYIKIIDHFKKVNLPFEDKKILKNKIYDLILYDKKNSNNRINLILLKKIGKAHLEIGLNKNQIKKFLS